MSSFNLYTNKIHTTVYNPYRFSKAAGETIILQNHSDDPVYVALDDAAISSDTGYEVAAGASWRAPRNYAGEVYIIGVPLGALVGQDIRVLSDVNVTVEPTPFLQLWTTPVEVDVDANDFTYSVKHRCHGRFGTDQGSAIDTALVVDISDLADGWGTSFTETPKFWDGTAMTDTLTVNPYGPGVGESTGPSVWSGSGPSWGTDAQIWSGWDGWCAYVDPNTYQPVSPGFADIVVDPDGSAFGNATGGDDFYQQDQRVTWAEVSGFATGSVFEGQTVTCPIFWGVPVVPTVTSTEGSNSGEIDVTIDFEGAYGTEEFWVIPDNNGYTLASNSADTTVTNEGPDPNGGPYAVDRWAVQDTSSAFAPTLAFTVTCDPGAAMTFYLGIKAFNMAPNGTEPVVPGQYGPLTNGITVGSAFGGDYTTVAAPF